MSAGRTENRLAFWFLLPSAVVLLGVVAYPFFFNVYISLTNWNMYHFRNPELIGLTHYFRLSARRISIASSARPWPGRPSTCFSTSLWGFRRPCC